MVTKVLKLDKSVLAVALNYCMHEFINEFIIGFTCHSLMSGTNIKFIFKKFLFCKIEKNMKLFNLYMTQTHTRSILKIRLE